MVCYKCSTETQIINSRLQKRSNDVWRRRKCYQCHMIFTTHESTDFTALWRVTNVKVALMPFYRDKLFLSLYSSLQHRPTALTDAGGLTTTILAKLTPVVVDGLLQSSSIVQIASVALHRFDSAASVHYQAFHKL